MMDWMTNFLKKLINCRCEEYSLQIDKLKQEINVLEEANKPNPQEEEFNSKYPKTDLTYLRHETDGDYQVDLRDFINPYDAGISVVIGKTDDEKALNALKCVMGKVKYVPDTSNSTYKEKEYWAYPYQTIKHKMGDCEDGAILLYNVMLKSGIPYWKIRLSAGNVKGGGHAYVTYYCAETDKWVVMDWCYWPNTLPVNQRPDYKDEKSYLEVWFSWNQKYCFTKGLNTRAKNILK